MITKTRINEYIKLLHRPKLFFGKTNRTASTDQPTMGGYKAIDSRPIVVNPVIAPNPEHGGALPPRRIRPPFR